MKKRFMLKSMLLLLLMSLILVGCGNAETPVEDQDKEQAPNVKTEAMIDELVEMTAEKYGTTKEEYLSDLESQGKTAYEEFKQAADYMEMTLEEYYEAEKISIKNLSQEDKDTMAGMSQAMEEAKNIDPNDFAAE